MEDFDLWAGGGFSSSEVEAAGNVYASMNVGAESLPESVKEFLEVKGVANAMVQFGSGNMEAEVATLAESTSPLSALQTISSAALMGQFKIVVAIKLLELTDHALPDMELGNAQKLIINGMLSTETVGGLVPGAYLYAEAGISMAQVMEDALKWANGCIGDIIDKIAGHSGIVETALNAVDKALGDASDSKPQFGLFVNTDGFGILFQFPVSAGIFPFDIPIGCMKLNCQYHIQYGGLTCAVDFDTAKWAAAIFQDAKMVVGDIKTSYDDAITSLKGGIQDDWTTVEHGVAKARGDVKTAAKTAASKVKSAAKTAVSKIKSGWDDVKHFF